ncbi:transposase family protein [Singulisphaera sp. Ch08]|uniref:Transposase family protein n=1 Tax=Singulisphaera sp. Ch08 TaxID=3120278 RepID=A0AAU7CFD7_9BACT
MDEINRHFAELEGPRSTINRHSPLSSVIVSTLMAVLAGAAGSTAIAKRAALKEELLVRTLDLPHGVPRRARTCIALWILASESDKFLGFTQETQQ